MVPCACVRSAGWHVQAYMAAAWTHLRHARKLGTVMQAPCLLSQARVTHLPPSAALLRRRVCPACMQLLLHVPPWGTGTHWRHGRYLVWAPFR